MEIYDKQKRKDAKTYEELKILAKAKFNEEKSINNFLNAIEIYDIDSTINNSLLLLELEENDERFNYDLVKYMNTLTLLKEKN